MKKLKLSTQFEFEFIDTSQTFFSLQEVYEFHLQASRASINVPEGARSEKAFKISFVWTWFGKGEGNEVQNVWFLVHFLNPPALQIYEM